MPPRSHSSPQPEAGPYSRHIPALDGLRGAAVVGVMCSHLFPGTTRSPLTIAVRVLFAFGATGVDLFFVLSGFLITGILIDTLQYPLFFRKFYARRALRIFPLYYGVLAAYGLGALLLGMRFNGELTAMALYLQNTYLVSLPISAYNGPSVLALAHFWSLAVEEQFYLVWPLVVFALRRRRWLLLLCFVLMVLCPLARTLLWKHGWDFYAVHENTLLRSDSLLTGGALALALRGRAHDAVLRWAPWVTGAGFVAAAVLAVAPFLAPQLSGLLPAELSLSYTAYNCLYVGVLALSLRPGPVQHVFTARPLRMLGRYSYGLYVLHYVIFNYLQAPLRSWLAVHVTPNKAVGVVACGLIVFLLSIAAAIMSFRFYEEPFLRLKRYVSYKRSAPSPSIAA